MRILVGKLRVDVALPCCATLPCFCLGFDKGSFSQGRGYTSYHTDAKGKRVEYPVCGTRQYHGCPTVSVCEKCRLSSPLEPGGPCDGYNCGGTRGACEGKS